jgi:hypothetical protein
MPGLTDPFDSDDAVTDGPGNGTPLLGSVAIDDPSLKLRSRQRIT